MFEFTIYKVIVNLLKLVSYFPFPLMGIENNFPVRLYCPMYEVVGVVY